MEAVEWVERDHETASFLAVVLPAEAEEAIARLRRSSGVSSEFVPHITVKGQPGLSDRNRWHDPVRDALKGVPRFPISFQGVGTFGTDVVFLRPEAAGLRRLHEAILDALDLAGIEERWEYDGEGYEPHLTLGAEFAGDGDETLAVLAAEAADLVLPSFSVGEVVEFRRAGPAGPYERVDTFPLGPSSADRHQDAPPGSHPHEQSFVSGSGSGHPARGWLRLRTFGR